MTVETLLPLFRTRFPEFITQTDARLKMYLADALIIFALSETAVLYLAAHLLSLDIDSGAGSTGASTDGGDGEVVSESAGGVSASFKSGAEETSIQE